MTHRAASYLCTLVWLLVISTPAAAQPSRALKVQLGAHRLLGDSGLVPPGVPDSNAQPGGVLVGLSALRCGPRRWSGGLELALEGNRVDVGPSFPATGAQVFGIATLRLLAVAECRLLHSEMRFQDTEPYALAGLGWNWNWVGTKVTWVGGTPDGAAVDLDLDHSPAMLLGLGVHQRVTHAGLYLNAEFGWKYNAGDARMTVAAAPDRNSHFDLSGCYLLAGLTLRTSALGAGSGAAASLCCQRSSR
jgi:hypothetical protein